MRNQFVMIFFTKQSIYDKDFSQGRTWRIFRTIFHISQICFYYCTAYSMRNYITIDQLPYYEI